MNLSKMMHFMEQKRHVQISLEIRHPAFYTCEELKLAPDQYLHHTEFCMRNKLADLTKSCAASKRQCVKQAEHFDRPFCRTCPFGVSEIVWPIRFRNELAAILFFERSHTCPGANDWHDARFLKTWILWELEKLAQSGYFENKQKTIQFYVERCRNYIDTHYAENITLSELSDFLHVTPNYLGKLLKNQLQKNFHTLLMERRIREAKIYLQFHLTLSIGEISAFCGFSDSNYFSTVFRKLCGMPPRSYRRKYAPGHIS